MKVSIIIPIYNVSKYIVRCLDSVSAQTFKDIECLLIDDRGTDNSVAIAEQYIQDYNGKILFKLLHHKKNRGLSAARNTGIDAANGDYLYFMDSDDAIVPETIETLLKLFEKYPDIEFAQGNILAEKREISSYGLKNSIPEYSNNLEELQRIMLSEITTVAWNRLIRRDFVLEHKLYFPEGYFTEDMYWGYFIVKYVRAAAFTHKGLYVYYINEGSMMTQRSKANRRKWLNSRIWTSNVYLSDIMANGSNQYQRQYIAVNMLSCLVELNAISSLRDWWHFWKQVNRWALSVCSKFSFYRFLFYLVLMPPICLLAHRDKLRWRIQQALITHI